MTRQAPLTTPRLLRLSLPLAAGLLAACGSSDSDIDLIVDGPQLAVVTTTASDFTSGAHALVEIEAPYQTTDDLDAAESDISVTTYGEHIFKLRRFNLDTVTKYRLDAPATPVWQYSTLDADDSSSANPYDLVFAATDKAFLLRYGSDTAWITDPSVGANQEADFKTGELDLSAYNPQNEDGSIASNPNMAAGLVVNGQLYVAMQRFDDNFNLHDAYVAVFDLGTDTEIQTGQDPVLPGIPLPVRNPMALDYDPTLDRIFVVGAGSTFPSSDYSGGIAVIDPSSFETELLIDDTASTGSFGAMEVVSQDRGYLITSAGFANNTLVAFDPRDGSFYNSTAGQPGAVAGLSQTNLTTLAADIGDRLWVGRGSDSNPGLTVIDTLDDSVVQSLIPLSRNPARVVFTRAR